MIRANLKAGGSYGELVNCTNNNAYQCYNANSDQFSTGTRDITTEYVTVHYDTTTDVTTFTASKACKVDLIKVGASAVESHTMAIGDTFTIPAGISQWSCVIS